jgi:RsiW-degrading membrane proteinase PrsW (M82 family)
VLGGAVRDVTASALEMPFTYGGAAFTSFVVAAGVEEACKIAVVYWIVWRRPDFDERLDGIVYASRAGLGFALVENVLYLTAQTTVNGALAVWFARAVLAVPGHAMWTGMIGAIATRRRFDGNGPGLAGGYLLAVAFHGTYNLSVFVQQPLRSDGHEVIARALIVAPVVLTVIAFFVYRAMARTALRLDDTDAARHALRAAVRPGVY